MRNTAKLVRLNTLETVAHSANRSTAQSRRVPFDVWAALVVLSMSCVDRNEDAPRDAAPTRDASTQAIASTTTDAATTDAAAVNVTPVETADYSCTRTADCEVKDVQNCCGYYPRCVNVDSPTPPPQCEGLSGACGWPDISHCLCVENTCRSMQGDTEI